MTGDPTTWRTTPACATRLMRERGANKLRTFVEIDADVARVVAAEMWAVMSDKSPPRPAIDPDLDDLDGHLFRFWIRGASSFPGELAAAIGRCLTPADYRRALIDVARRHGVNFELPPPIENNPEVGDREDG